MTTHYTIEQRDSIAAAWVQTILDDPAATRFTSRRMAERVRDYLAWKRAYPEYRVVVSTRAEGKDQS